MTQITANKSIRQTLIGGFINLYKYELEKEGAENLYDERFLIRMGKQGQKINRSSSRATWLMVAIDVLIFLIFLGYPVKITLLGNEIASFLGIVEIGLVFASLIYFYAVVKFVDSSVHNALIDATLAKINPDNFSSFYKGSLLPTDYTWHLVPVRGLIKGLFTSSKIHTSASVVIVCGVLLIEVGPHVLHVIVACLGGYHIFQSTEFGILGSLTVLVAITFFNLLGLLLFCITCIYPFKFSPIDECLNLD